MLFRSVEHLGKGGRFGAEGVGGVETEEPLLSRRLEAVKEEVPCKEYPAQDRIEEDVVVQRRRSSARNADVRRASHDDHHDADPFARFRGLVVKDVADKDDGDQFDRLTKGDGRAAEVVLATATLLLATQSFAQRHVIERLILAARREKAVGAYERVVCGR